MDGLCDGYGFIWDSHICGLTVGHEGAHVCECGQRNEGNDG